MHQVLEQVDRLAQRRAARTATRAAARRRSRRPTSDRASGRRSRRSHAARPHVHAGTAPGRAVRSTTARAAPGARRAGRRSSRRTASARSDRSSATCRRGRFAPERRVWAPVHSRIRSWRADTVTTAIGTTTIRPRGCPAGRRRRGRGRRHPAAVPRRLRDPVHRARHGAPGDPARHRQLHGRRTDRRPDRAWRCSSSARWPRSGCSTRRRRWLFVVCQLALLATSVYFLIDRTMGRRRSRRARGDLADRAGARLVPATWVYLPRTPPALAATRRRPSSPVRSSAYLRHRKRKASAQRNRSGWVQRAPTRPLKLNRGEEMSAAMSHRRRPSGGFWWSTTRRT